MRQNRRVYTQLTRRFHHLFYPLLLLLLLSCFSRVRLCATPEATFHQAPLYLGFSRQEHWSVLPFPSPMHESVSEVTQSCLTPNNSIDCSPPGSYVHGICQARVLEWGAIAYPLIKPYYTKALCDEASSLGKD